jgi:hypothetical protein
MNGYIFHTVGGILAVAYTLLTSSKKDYNELGLLLVITISLILFATSWSGLVVSIAADVVH